MSGLLQHAGIRQRDKPHALASLLDRGHRPVTLLFRDTFGIELRLTQPCAFRGILHPGQAHALGAPEGAPCRYRTARLETADGRLAAGVFLLWLPGRLPAEAAGALDAAAEPAGAILARLPGGMHREDLRALATANLDEITGHPYSVMSRAVLVACGRRVGYAEENWMTGFVESLP